VTLAARRTSAGAVVVVLALGWTLVAPAGAAQAAVLPPPPVTQLGSVIGSQLGTASTATTVEALMASEGTGFLAGAGAYGGPIAVGGVLAIGGTSKAVHVITGYGSGNFVCDVQSLWNDACAAGPGVGYTINSDVAAGVPGWTPNPPVLGLNGNVPWTGASVVFAAPAMPAYGWTGVLTDSNFALPISLNSGTYTGGSCLTYLGLRIFYADGTQFFFGNQNPSGFACYGQPTTNTVHASGLNLTGHGGFGYVTVSNSNESPTSAGAGKVSWYPVGHPSRPADVPGDPVRRFVTTWTCTVGSGGSLTSVAFHESDASWPAIPAASCPGAGSQVKHLEVQETSTAGAPRTIVTWDLPPEVQAAGAARPECVEGTCILDLTRVDPGTGTRLDCFNYPNACADWWRETSSATSATSDYECSYGGAAVALTECRIYSHAFGADPTYADPRTGDVPDDAPAPPEGSPETCPPPFSWSGLLSAWWAWKATACALSWAFVPADGFVGDELDSLRADVGTKAPFSVIAAVPGAVGGLAQGWDGSCSALPDFSPVAGEHLTMPCSPPASAGWTAAYALMTALVWIGAVLGLWRMAHNAVGGNQ
jgi:hypothetical protein